jgi:iron-sulfur cluster repair protein YtfE (RIC family)
MSQRAKPEAGAVGFFTDDHRACDELWAAVEAAADDGHGVEAAFDAFDAAMRRHMDMEERVLFPAFEEATGMTMGPTRVMRAEHDQMRGLLSQMKGADADSMLDHGDTLLMLIQQHNVKEEGMLYPMCDARLGSVWPEVAKQLSRY